MTQLTLPDVKVKKTDEQIASELIKANPELMDALVWLTERDVNLGHQASIGYYVELLRRPDDWPPALQQILTHYIRRADGHEFAINNNVRERDAGALDRAAACRAERCLRAAQEQARQARRPERHSEAEPGMVAADIDQVIASLEPLCKQGYVFEPAGECVLFRKPYARVPYVMVSSLLATDDPCKYAARELAGGEGRRR